MINLYIPDYKSENKSDKELLIKEVERNRERTTKIFDEAIEQYREKIRIQEKYYKNTKQYKDFNEELSDLIILKERMLSPSGFDDWSGNNERKMVGDAFVEALDNKKIRITWAEKMNKNNEQE
jgi:hypothetical protein